jgi:hypothetical protein
MSAMPFTQTAEVVRLVILRPSQKRRLALWGHKIGRLGY